jgi:hypothetical protein
MTIQNRLLKINPIHDKISIEDENYSQLNIIYKDGGKQ